FIDKRVKAKNFKAGGINAFIIYRASYVKELKTSTGDKISMRYISKYISEMWNKEPIGVKNHYRQLSSQLENELTEIRRENLVYIDNNESNYKKRRRTTKTTQNQISISEGIVSINYNKKRRRTTKTTQNQISISEGI
ncbi:12597_t:CDS:1, partial [Entrophospora sp. SA101]